MAHLLHVTTFRVSTVSTTVTIPATAAGCTLVCRSQGSAVVLAKLGVGGTSFTKRSPTSLSNQEVACQDIVDSAGGSTAVQIVLNGAINVDGEIYEFASLGAYLGGVAPNTTPNDAQQRVSPGSLVLAGPAVVLSGFASIDTNGAEPHRWWGLDPLGTVVNAGWSNGGAQYWYLSGVSDVPAGTWTPASVTLFGSTTQSGAWAYADASGVPTYPAPANQVVGENSRAGSISTYWYGALPNANVAGYTDRTSYLPGDTVAFKVDSGGNAFSVEVARVGHYGYVTIGGRHVTTVVGSPAAQPAPTVDVYGGTTCGWSTTASWAVPADACPGVYVANFRRGDNAAFVSQHLFVVRSAKPSSKQADRIGLRVSDYTWQAYNLWGSTADHGNGVTGYTGRSLYGAGGVATLALGGRAFAVSFDRPYSTNGLNPSTFFWDSEVSLIGFLEANGYQVDYYSSADVDADTSIPSRYQVFVSAGHDEYWSTNLWDAYAVARDAGTHLVFSGGNLALWHVRFDPADSGRRRMICYKDSHNAVGFDGVTKFDPVSYTGTWRDARTVGGGVNNPLRRTDASLSGQWFIGNGPFSAAAQVPATYAGSPYWRNTAVAVLTSGQTYTVLPTVAFTVGYEWDYLKTAETTTPANLVMLARRDITLTSQAASDNGDTYSGSGTFGWGVSLYRAASGALVFCAGSWRWTIALSRFRLSTLDANGAVDLAVQQATVNLLRDMGLPPVTLLDAVRNNTTALVDPGAVQPASAYGLSSGPAWSLWSGSAEVPLGLAGVWDGTVVQGVTSDVV